MVKEKRSLSEEIARDLKTVSYVADVHGQQELVSGTIWQPVNVVNHQAWQEIEKHIDVSKEKIAAGQVSCLHYYMTANQMDPGLLAQYSKQPRLLVHLHLKPFFFKRLGPKTLHKYSQIFNVSMDDLKHGRLLPPVYEDCTNHVSSDD